VATQSSSSVKVIIDVMLKAEILDPQGQAIANALPRMGFSLIPVSTRQGKRFEFTFDHAPTEVEIAEIKKNMMFENFQKVIYLAEQDLNKLS
jgi:phosphoribosylformylglycinamidine synthase